MTWGSVLQFAADQLRKKTRDLEQDWRERRTVMECPRTYRKMTEDLYLQGQAERYAFKIKRRIRTVESIRREIGEFKAARDKEPYVVAPPHPRGATCRKVCRYCYDSRTGEFDTSMCPHLRCRFAHSKAELIEGLRSRPCTGCLKGSRCHWVQQVFDQGTGEHRAETEAEYFARTGKILGELPHEARARNWQADDKEARLLQSIRDYRKECEHNWGYTCPHHYDDTAGIHQTRHVARCRTCGIFGCPGRRGLASITPLGAKELLGPLGREINRQLSRTKS